MARFKPLTKADVTFTFEMEEEEISPAGQFASGDDAQDAADVADIQRRLASGDGTAWFCLVVTATAPDGTSETDTLGCCSLAAEPWGPGMSGSAVAKRVEAFARESDMHTEALARLNDTRRAAHDGRTVRMCETWYMGPTDHRGSRVRARHVTTRKVVTLSWDDELDSFENHAEAATLVLGRRPEFSCSVDGGGYLMGVDPRNDKEPS